jgi:hypothetical protein
MNKFLVFAFVAFLCHVIEAEEKVQQGALEWPFYMDDEEDLYVDVKIGNPQQEIQISLFYFHQTRDMVLVPKYNGGEFYGGQFETKLVTFLFLKTINCSISKTLIDMKGNIFGSDGELIGTSMYDDFEVKIN